MSLGAPIPPPKERVHPRTELLAPTPTKDRDTIHNIVDIYNRDSVISAGTSDFQPASIVDDPREHDDHEDHEDPEAGGTGEPSHDAYASSRSSGYSQRQSTGSAMITVELDEGRDHVGEMERLSPPNMVFDLTPGREPSPARYKHGEPLSFGESPCAFGTHELSSSSR